MQESRTPPTFTGKTPRILLLTSQYFLIGELEAACKRLDVEHLFLNLDTKEMTLDSFVTQMTGALTGFIQPRREPSAWKRLWVPSRMPALSPGRRRMESVWQWSWPMTWRRVR